MATDISRPTRREALDDDRPSFLLVWPVCVSVIERGMERGGEGKRGKEGEEVDDGGWEGGWEGGREKRE